KEVIDFSGGGYLRDANAADLDTARLENILGALIVKNPAPLAPADYQPELSLVYRYSAGRHFVGKRRTGISQEYGSRKYQGLWNPHLIPPGYIWSVPDEPEVITINGLEAFIHPNVANTVQLRREN